MHIYLNSVHRCQIEVRPRKNKYAAQRNCVYVLEFTHRRWIDVRLRKIPRGHSSTGLDARDLHDVTHVKTAYMYVYNRLILLDARDSQVDVMFWKKQHIYRYLNAHLTYAYGWGQDPNW